MTDKIAPAYTAYLKLKQAKFDKLVESRQELSVSEKKIKSDLAKLNEKIASLMIQTGLTPGEKDKNAVQVGKWRVTLAKGKHSEKVIPRLLLEAGVKSEVIKRCTEKKDGDPYIMVSGENGDLG